MSSFKLSSGDSEFNNRVDALFNSLQTAAVDLVPESGKRSLEDDDDDVDETSVRLGQKFKRPAGLPPRSRGGGGPRGRGFGPRNSTPDYIQNPKKWTKYTMKDTKVSSDRENKQIGLELFDELRSRRMEEGAEGREGEETDCPKIVFKKPAKSEVREEVEDGDSEKVVSSIDAMFGGTQKIRMEEYEVGRPKSKSKSKSVKNTECDEKNKKDIVKLDYLTFEEDEDD